MSAHRVVRLAIIACVAIAVVGCSTLREKKLSNPLPSFGGTPGLLTESVRSINTVIVHRIAVMPIIDAPNEVNGTLPAGASEALTANIYSRLPLVGGWDVVPEDDVENAMRQLPPTTSRNLQQNALALGRLVSADAVLYGELHNYRERVGYEYAAQQPASVAFNLNLIDLHTKQVVWSAKFAREQKALSQNFFNIFNFVQNKGRWVKAEDIASEGVQGAVADLRSKLPVAPPVQTVGAPGAPAPIGAPAVPPATLGRMPNPPR